MGGGKNTLCLTIWLLSAWIAVSCSVASAQNLSNKPSSQESARKIDINIFNRYDDHRIDPTYMGNKKVFEMLDTLMLDTLIINNTQRINVLSTSSIEGSVAYNTALSQRRMQTIAETFYSRYSHIATDMWHFSYAPENWTHLRSAVASDTRVPNQERVLSIIDMEEADPDSKERQLKTLDKGRSWSYIHQHILPASRGSVSMLFVPTSVPPIPTPSLSAISVNPVEPSPTLYNSFPDMKYSHPLVSIRSNLLLDLTTTLNIGVEVPIAPRWSLSAEYINPWWKCWDSDMTWQIQTLYFDVRYWLGSRTLYNSLTGWSIGAYAGSGCYDLQPLSDTGVQGEYTDYGLTLSYAHHLWGSKRWLMEYNLGVGYLTTHYRHYYTADNTDEYGNIKVHRYPWSEETLRAPMPTRLGVTLAYLININSVKRGGGK